MWFPFLRDLWRSGSPRTQQGRRLACRKLASLRLTVEVLEDRCLLSATGSLAGTVFEDLAGNGITLDDQPTQGWTVNLFRDNGDGTFDASSDTFIGRQTTGRDGGYEFRRLAAGTYFVQEELRTGWVQTVPAPEPVHDAVLTPNDDSPPSPESNDTLATAVATGLRSATPGTFVAGGAIGDNPDVAPTLDVDLYRFQLNAGDLARIDIDAVAFGSGLDSNLRVFDAAGNQVASNEDAIGDSSDPQLDFLAKTTGTYYVGVSGFVNWQYDPTTEGSGDPERAFSAGEYTIQIDVGPRPGAEPVAVTLAAGEQRTGVDLGNFRLGSIQGQVFDDIDGDGVHDDNEPGLDGWAAGFAYRGVIFAFTTTRSIDLNHDGRINPLTESGLYEFDDLGPGVYFTGTLVFLGLGPDGWVQTSPPLDRPRPPLIGEVSSGPSSGPGVGLLPDLTEDLANGLGDWFVIGNTLYFGQATPNVGLGPMELRGGADLGDGTQLVYQRIYQDPGLTTYIDREAGTFVFHPEHNHIHFNDYAQYSLRQTLPDADGDGLPEVGAVVAGGIKSSFCLVDAAPYDLTLPNAAQEPSGYGCSTVQRISVGWEDIYGPITVGQQIDITGLAPGQYWLESIVDPDNHLLEANENNNTGRVLITIGHDVPDAPAGLHGVQLTSGQVVRGQDFGNFHLNNVSGTVFDDLNGNGRQDRHEEGLAGWTVFVDVNGDGVLNNPEGDGIPSALAEEPWAITDVNGDYVLEGVGPGTLLIREVPQAGWVQTTRDPKPLRARSGHDVSGVDFGNAQIQGGALLAADLHALQLSHAGHRAEDALFALLATGDDPWSEMGTLGHRRKRM